MKNLEQLKKDFESLPEQEKDIIKNLTKSEEKDFEKVVGGLSALAKRILIGLGIVAAIGGGGTALYKLGESQGNKEGVTKGKDLLVGAKLTLESLRNNFMTGHISKETYNASAKATIQQLKRELGSDFILELKRLNSMLEDQRNLL